MIFYIAVNSQSVVQTLDPPHDDGYFFVGMNVTVKCEATNSAIFDSQVYIIKETSSQQQLAEENLTTIIMPMPGSTASGVVEYTIFDLQEDDTGIYCCLLNSSNANLMSCVDIQTIG